VLGEQPVSGIVVVGKGVDGHDYVLADRGELDAQLRGGHAAARVAVASLVEPGRADAQRRAGDRLRDAVGS